MMKTCNRQRIEAFLTHQLTSPEEQAFEEHLTQCDDCRQRLDNATAEVHWWSDVTDFLPADENDLPVAVSNDIAIHEHLSTPAGIPLSGNIQNVLQLLAPTDDPGMLGRFGCYEIAGVIGAGGMSVVLKGFDRSLNRFVAIKVLSPHLATSGAARQRFAREAQATAAIVHDNVIAIFGVEEDATLPFLVMPYVRGESLQTRLDRTGPLGLEEILRVAQQTAAGLAAAHAQGLVHRDVKPANVLLTHGTERVTITDFGLARAADDASLTRSGTIAGTPQYMSPEQARGDSVDGRSDLFSLGSVIYAMCTGHPPFRSETGYGVLRRITDSTPRPIREVNHTIPDWLCRIVNRLHAKRTADRYPSATALAVELEQCLSHLRQPQERLPAWLDTPKWNRPTSLARVAVAATILLFAGLLVSQWPNLQRNAGVRESGPSDTEGTTSQAVNGEESSNEVASDEVASDEVASSPESAVVLVAPVVPKVTELPSDQEHGLPSDIDRELAESALELHEAISRELIDLELEMEQLEIQIDEPLFFSPQELSK